MSNNSLRLGFVIFFIALIYSLLPLIPVYYRYTHTPANIVYLGAEKYYPDYYLYLNFLQQGKNNQLLMHNDYTSENISSTPVHLEYLGFGRLGSLFHLSAPLSFHLSRFLLNMVFAAALFWFLRLFFRTNYQILITFLLVLFYTGPFTNYFFSPPDFLARASLDPHHILGEIFTLLTMGLFLKLKRSPYTLILLGLSSLALSYFFTTGILIIFATLFLYLMLSRINLIRTIKIITVIFFSTIPLLLYLFYLFKTNPSLMNIANLETYFSATDAREKIITILTSYVSFFWPMLIFIFSAIAGLIIVNKKNVQNYSKWLLILAYIIVHLAFFLVLFQFLDISRMRMFRLPFLVFYSLLTVFGLDFLAKLLKKSVSQKMKYINGFAVVTGGLLILIISLTSYPKIFSQELSYGLNPVDEGVFISKQVYEGINLLPVYTSRHDYVLANTYLSALIPGLTGNGVYAGHMVNTINYNIKQQETEKFFSHNLTDTFARQLLEKNNLGFVLTDQNLSFYDFLKPMAKKGDFTLYKFQK